MVASLSAVATPPRATSFTTADECIGSKFGSKARKQEKQRRSEKSRKCSLRKGGRVVDCTGLENQQRRKTFEGSNPSPSASNRLHFYAPAACDARNARRSAASAAAVG